MTADGDNLTAAVRDMTVVLEGLHNQIYLLRHELEKQREQMQRGLDDPICVDAVAGELEKMMGGY